jgi:hypothetical protein
MRDPGQYRGESRKVAAALRTCAPVARRCERSRRAAERPWPVGVHVLRLARLELVHDYVEQRHQVEDLAIGFLIACRCGIIR